MEFSELTPDKRSAVKLDVFNRTSYLKLAESLGFDNNSNVSLEYVKLFLEMPEENLADGVVAAYDKIRGLFANTIHSANPPVAKYQVVWGRICAWMYFFKYDDILWTRHILPLMIERRVCSAIREDIERAKKLVDEYNVRQNQIKDLISSRKKSQLLSTDNTNPNGKNIILSDKPHSEDLEKVFTYNYRQTTSYNLLIDFLCDESKNASDADWARHALALYDNRRGFTRNIPASFKKWLRKFCDLFGREWKRYYEPKKLHETKIVSKVPTYLTLSNNIG